MIEAFTTAWEAVITFIVSTFASVQSIFWTPGAADAPGELTFVGLCTVIVLGISFFSFVIGIIINTIKMRS